LKGGENVGSIGIGVIQSKFDVNMESKARVGGQQTNNGFGSVLSSIMGSNNGISNEESVGNENLLSKEEIGELITFLQNQDIFSLENGGEILNNLTADNKMLAGVLALENLSISEMDLTKLIDELKKTLGLDGKNLKSDSLDASDLNEKMDDLVALLSMIQSLPNQSFQKLVDQDFAKLVKFSKLVELLSKNQDSETQNGHLTKLIDSITSKLEQLVKSNSASFRTEYLQKTFTLLSGEINQKISTISSITGKQVEGIDVAVPLMQQMSKPEQLTLMLDSTRRPVSTEQLIQQFESILAKSQFSKMNGMEKLLIKLAPEHLGSLRIELIHKDQMLVAKILTTTGAAKETLESQLNGLKQAMMNQNIQVEKIEISQQMTPQERSLQRDPHQQGREQEENNKKQELQQDTQTEFNDSLLEALNGDLNLKV
jgi:flagellar hook-length control protein FliK